jgi:DNA-binding transcriptional MerR regulator
MKPSVFQETAAAVAKRFGVTVKALRVYEELGLLKPARTMSGWRIYRQPELEQLSAILALKQLGMPLKRIGELMRGAGDLSTALALQEAALVDAKSATEFALKRVRAARAKVADKKRLSPDELSNLVRSTAMSELKWNDKMEALVQKHYTPEQLQVLRARPLTAQLAWAKMFADINALGPNADPASPQALALGRRAQALIAEITQGDPTLLKPGAAIKKALDEPELAAQRPDTTARRAMAMLERILAELRKRGEPQN